MVRSAVGISVVLMLGMLGGVPAFAASASPSVIDVDCDLTNGVPATTITGLVGDTFIVDNSAASTGQCTFGSTSGVVTTTNLSSSKLAAGASSVVTILSAGTFTIAPSGGSNVDVTVVIGTPIAVPEYTITFDADGGSCTSGATLRTGPATDWYVMPTSSDCRRSDYSLKGWSRVPAGQPEFAPGSPGQFHEDETLYAVWQPEGVAITFDANVGVDVQCLDQAGRIVDLGARSITIVWPANEGFILPREAACTPFGHTLVGWAKSGSGPVLFSPGEDDGTVGLTNGSSITLYAQWRPDFDILLADKLQAVPGPSPCVASTTAFTIPTEVRPLNFMAGVDDAFVMANPVIREVDVVVTLTCPSGGGTPTVSVGATWGRGASVNADGISSLSPTSRVPISSSAPQSEGALIVHANYAPVSQFWTAQEAASRAPESVTINFDGRVMLDVGLGQASYDVFGVAGRSV